MRKTALVTVLLVVGAVACGIGGVALGGMLSGCGGAADKPVVAPNPNGADCLAARQTAQLDCVQRFSTRADIDNCIAQKKLPECTTEAGVAEFITSRDAGGDK